MNVKAPIAGLFALNGVVWLPLLLGLAGVLYCSAAAYFALADVWGPALAAVATGAGMLALAALLGWLLIRQLSSPKPKAHQADARDNPSAESALRPFVGDKAAGWIQENPGPVAVAALAAGALLATSSTVRHAAARSFAPLALRGAARALQELSEKDR